MDFNRNNFSIFEMNRIIDDNEIVLDPDFQRNSNIWNDAKKAKLIESIFNGDTYTIILFCRK